MKLTVLIILITSSVVQSQWFIDTYLNSRDLSDIFVVNQVVYTGGDSVKIFKSTDLGSNWNFIHQPVSDGILTLSFINELTGYAAGGNFLYKTSTGGTSWITYFPGSYKEIDFLNELTGYAVSDAIHKTTNGGQSFSQYVNFLVIPRAIDMLNVNTGWVVGQGNPAPNYALRTTNGGSNWYRAALGPPIREAVSFFDRSFGVAVGWTDDFNITTDGGVTWTIGLRIGIPGNYSDVKCVTRNIIYAVGDLGVTVKSTDSGISWFQQASGTTDDYMPFFLLMNKQDLPADIME